MIRFLACFIRDFYGHLACICMVKDPSDPCVTAVSCLCVQLGANTMVILVVSEAKDFRITPPTERTPPVSAWSKIHLTHASWPSHVFVSS
jgi:hypothetical protein